MSESVKSECRDKPSAGFSVTVRLEIENRPGGFARITQQLAQADASLAEVTLISSDFDHTVRDVTIACKSDHHAAQIIELLGSMDKVTLLSWQDDTLAMHLGGKLRVESTSILKTTDELSRAYTPGVARVCNMIHRDPESAYQYTIKGNCVAVVTDGSAVLGLGNIGSKAALPVMEGKAMLFKQFAGVDAFPICIESQDSEEIISTVKNISAVFGGINLEDISSPRCFEIEQRLQDELDIPIFHDDQHGTAVVVLAGLLNALKIVGKKLDQITVAVNGFGASGVACTKLMMLAGVRNVIACDRSGIIYKGRADNMNSVKQELAEVTNIEGRRGRLEDAVRGADVFLGVSQPGMLTPDMVRSMAKDPVVFALANPVPEVLPGEIQGIARIIATGRSDYANQVNNVLCFPGIFKGALECRARKITSAMKIAAAYAISECVSRSELREEYIIPNIFKVDVASKVAARVKEEAVKENLHRVAVNDGF